MDKEIKQEFEKINTHMTNLADGVASGFVSVQTEITELRSENKAICQEIEGIPYKIDAMYSGVFNNLLERVVTVERKVDVLESSRA